MNNEQRKQIATLIESIGLVGESDLGKALETAREALDAAKQAHRDAADALAQRVEELRGDVEDLKSEEEDKLENMPENMKEGDKGQTMQEGIDRLGDACESLDCACDLLTDEEGDIETLTDDVALKLAQAIEELEQVG